jgi:nucleoid-associated protein YgaU
MFDQNENDYIKDRSLLLGRAAEAQSREKRVLASNRNLKTLLFVSLLLLPMSHCWFRQPEAAQLSQKNEAVLRYFREQQLQASFGALQHLVSPDSSFLYVIQEGDKAEALAQQFYGDPRYAYMILLDNRIKNARTLTPKDTLRLRFRPEIIEKNRYLDLSKTAK